MKIIKRNGSEETFNIEKIINAIRKANNSAESVPHRGADHRHSRLRGVQVQQDQARCFRRGDPGHG